MALTAATVWAAFQHLGVWNTPVALTIAVTKALLVALIFMHLRSLAELTASSLRERRLARDLLIAHHGRADFSDSRRDWLPSTEGTSG